MKLNQQQATHVIVDNKSIYVDYLFTKDEICGQSINGNIWAVMKFLHPETKQKERLKVIEPARILNASEDEIHSFKRSRVLFKRLC